MRLCHLMTTAVSPALILRYSKSRDCIIVGHLVTAIVAFHICPPKRGIRCILQAFHINEMQSTTAHYVFCSSTVSRCGSDKITLTCDDFTLQRTVNLCTLQIDVCTLGFTRFKLSSFLMYLQEKCCNFSDVCIFFTFVVSVTCAIGLTLRNRQVIWVKQCYF